MRWHSGEPGSEVIGWHLSLPIWSGRRFGIVLFAHAEKWFFGAFRVVK